MFIRFAKMQSTDTQAAGDQRTPEGDPAIRSSDPMVNGASADSEQGIFVGHDGKGKADVSEQAPGTAYDV